MNPEHPIDPRQSLEPSLTALLLGELTEDQARFVRQAIATDPELAKAFERLKQTTALLRETQVRPQPEPAAAPASLRLSESRRQELLGRFKTVQPEPFKYPPAKIISWLVPAAAVLLLTLVLASALLPALSRSKAKSMAQLRRSEGLDRQVMPSDSAGGRAQSASVKLAETAPPALNRSAAEETLARNKVALATSDDKHLQGDTGKALDSTAGVQYFGLDSRKLAPESRGLVPRKQVLVLPTAGKPESEALSGGVAASAQDMWSFKTFNSRSQA